MSSGVVESFMRHYFLVTVFLTQLFFWVVDIGRWAVRLGRYAFERISNAPKGWFRWDRDPL